MSHSTKDIEKLRQYLAVIAQPVRLDILVMLKGGEQCVCDIYEKLGIAQNLTSHHLKVLTDLGLLTSQKDGVKVLYARNEKKVAEYQAMLNDTVGQGTCACSELTVRRGAGVRVCCGDG